MSDNKDFGMLMKKIFLFFVLLLPTALYVQENAEQGVAAAQDEKLRVQTTEIPMRADETHAALSNMMEVMQPRAEIVAIEEELPQAVDSLKTLLSDTLYSQLDSLSLRQLQNLRQDWTILSRQLDSWVQMLLARTVELEEYNRQAKQMAKEWEDIRSNIGEEAPEAIVARINAIVAEVDTVKKRLAVRTNTLLIYQTLLSEQQIKIKDLLTRIGNVEAKKRGRVFVLDSPPLWQAFHVQQDTLGLGAHVKDVWSNFAESLNGFARANKSRLYIHLGIFLVMLFIMVYFFRRNRGQRLFDEGEEVLRASAFFISRPVSAALLIAMFFAVWLYDDPTVTIRELFIVLISIPLLRLITGVVVRQRVKSVYILAFLYLLLFLHNNLLDNDLLKRLLLILITLGAIALLSRLFWDVRPVKDQQARPWPKLIFILLPLSLLALFVSLAANAIGAVTLAQVSTEGVVKGILTAIILYTIARVSDGLVVLLIRKRTTKSFHFVNTYAARIEQWAVVVIHLVAFLLWLRALLTGFRLLQPLVKWFQGLLTTQWTVGSAVVSMGNIVNFFLVLIFSIVLARLLSVLLALEVFPRVRLPRGIPGAISMVVRYTTIGIGIFLSLSALGLDLGKFGLLAGALGVGLGFGLQNVIANFVSGLILAFERPIQVGDKVEVDNVLGNVKRIGVRSSTIKTFDGSEVIVPNADFISTKVINWTLSDTRQRIKLPVKVAFDNDPEQVLELLLTVAKEHPEVLEDPEPLATFNGFGDYYLDFTLYFWVLGNIYKNQTEVAVNVFRALKEAGIDRPTPQQDLYLKALDALTKVKKKNTSAGKKSSPTRRNSARSGKGE